ncbi:hypothetical protein ACFVU2_02455 [Leifsonia sp. NPDC058194]|uniref:hypothetical protein n=1 Tax=Leifsonia sp. NPDC058194 TaxID=3346374 RepID=UPI0036DF85A7
MSGPRDWSPAGYWDEPPAAEVHPARSGPTGWWMAVALLLGTFAIVWPLGMSSSSPDGVGWAVTTAGVSAVSIAVWYRRSGGGLALPSIAGALGLVGTILCIWSLAAASLPGTIPSLSSAFGIPAAAHGGASGDAGVGAPACRVDSPEPVPVAEGSAADQQRADAVQGAVAVLADAVCVQAAGGAYPDSLAVAEDRTVTSPAGVIGSLPAGMVLEYARTDTGFSLTVSDESGMPSGSIEFR